MVDSDKVIALRLINRALVKKCREQNHRIEVLEELIRNQRASLDASEDYLRGIATKRVHLN